MYPSLAAVVCVVGMLGLFILDRDPKSRTSWAALCIPGLWLLIAGSRHVSQWLGLAPVTVEHAYLEGSPLDAVIYGLIIGAGMILLFGRRRAVAKILRNNWPILLFVVYCALSVAWSDFPESR